MICIKKFICILFCLFLVSCTQKTVSNPFENNDRLTGTYVCDKGTFTVTVTKNSDSVTVEPNTPCGYSVTFSDDGGKAAFNGLEFDDRETLSLFYPLFEMVRGINTTFTENTVTHSDGYVFGDFK